MKKLWHTEQEHRIIKRLGGKVHRGNSFDGIIRGKPVEVRSQRKDNRYRLQKDVHKLLLRKKGSYIFVRPSGRIKKILASKVNQRLLSNKRKWYKDRNYPHTFILNKEVF